MLYFAFWIKTVVFSPKISLIIHFFKLNGFSENSKVNPSAFLLVLLVIFKEIMHYLFFKLVSKDSLSKFNFFLIKIEKGELSRGILFVVFKILF